MIILIDEEEYKIAIRKGLECFGVKNKTKVFMRRFLKNSILHYDVLKKCISNLNDEEKQQVILNQLNNIYECNIDVPKSYIKAFVNDISYSYLIELLIKILIKKKDIEGIELIIFLCEDKFDENKKKDLLRIVNLK